MFRMKSLVLSLSVSLALALVTTVEAQNPQLIFEKDIKPILLTYCYECHNAELQEGKVRLDNLNPDLVAGPDAQQWHHALDMINQGDMPPEDAEHPDEETLEILTDWIQTELVKSI